jgi:hypothetical protein
MATSGGPETSGKGYTMTCQGGVWVRITESDTAGNLGVKQAAPKAPLHVGGEVIIGVTTGLACDADREGAIRYNTTADVLEFCDATTWTALAAGSACDSAPAFFAFTAQTQLATSTQYSSNIVAVAGMDAACDAVVGVSGSGVPEYRVCSTSNCSSVDQTWTTANNTIAMQGKFIQLRATTSASAGTTFTITASIGATTSTWDITTIPTDCSTGAIGTVCADGSVYAGTSPDGDVPMYAARCDYNMTWDGASCVNTRTGISWNDGNGGWVDTTLVNCVSVLACNNSGETNTTTLIAEDSNSSAGGSQPHAAAQYCSDLSVHGQTDWYLPSAPELNILFTNKTAIANFEVNGSLYWSSSENTNDGAWVQRFSDGAQGNFGKYNGNYVRCVRRWIVFPEHLSGRIDD